MHVDSDIVTAYYGQVNGAVSQPDGSNWGFPCNEPLPDFSLQIGDGTAVIPGKLMNAGLLINGAPLPRKTFSSSSPSSPSSYTPHTPFLSFSSPNLAFLTP